MAVVMLDVLDEDGFELAPVEDKDPVEALAADRADEPLREGVRSWRSDRCSDDPNPLDRKSVV